MAPLSELRLRRRWSSSRNDLAAEFYGPCLARSVQYDRAVGYFRSSFLLITGIAVAEFALRGGAIRLVCSPLLEPADIEAIAKGYDSRQRVDEAILRDLESILKRPEARTSVELLAALVSSEHLEIKLAFRPQAAGIFHDKLGIFTDDQGNRVSFSGSINESLTAWDHKLK